MDGNDPVRTSRRGLSSNSGPRTSANATVRPPASTTATVWAAASWRLQRRVTQRSGCAMGRTVPRSGQVPTTTSAPASRSRRTALLRCAYGHRGRGLGGDVVRADEDAPPVGLRLQRPVDLVAEFGRRGSRLADHAEAYRAFGDGGQAVGEQHARGPGRIGHPQADGEGIAQQDHGDRGAGEVAVDAVGRRPLHAVRAADHLPGQQALGHQQAVRGGAESRQPAAAECRRRRDLARRARRARCPDHVRCSPRPNTAVAFA